MSTDDEFDSNIPLRDRTRMNKASCSGVRAKSSSCKPFKQSSRKKNQKQCSRNHSSVPKSLTRNHWMISETPSPYLIGPKKRQSIDKVEQPARPKRTCLSDRLFISSQNQGRKNGCIDILPHKQSEKSPKRLFPNVRYTIGKKSYMEPTTSFEDASGHGSYKPAAAAFNTVPNMETPSSSSSSSSSSSASSSSNNQTYPFSKITAALDDILAKPSTSTYDLDSQQNGNAEDKSNSLGVNFIDSESDCSEIHCNIPPGCSNQLYKFHPARKVMGKGLRKVLESEDEDDDDSDGSVDARFPNTYRRGVPLIHSDDSDDSSDIPVVTKKSFKKRNLSQLSSTDSNEGSTNGFVYSPTHSRTSCFSKKSSSEHSSDCSRSKNPCSHSHVTRDALREYTNSSSVSSSTSHSSKSLHDHSYPLRGAPKRYAANSSSVSSSTSLSSQSTTSSSSGDRNVRYSHRDSSGRQAISPLLRVTRSRCQTSLSRSAMSSQPSNSQHAHRRAMDFAARYPGVFDPEESSEMEFFTANSYSDTEASISTVESLGDGHVATRISSRSYPNNITYPASGSSPSEDEISVIFTTGAAFPESASRRRVRHRGGGGRRRRTRGTSRTTSLNSTQDLTSVSPDPVEQVRQMEEDEQFARMLQAQFDAEMAGRGEQAAEADEVLEASRPSTTESDNESTHNLLDSLFDVEMVPFPSSPRSSSGGTMTPILAARGRPRFAVPSNIMFLGGGRRRRGRRSHSVQGDPWMYQFARVLGLSPAYTSPDESDYETLLRFAETVGDEIPRGLRKAQINRLPTRKFYFPGAGPSTSQGHEDVIHKRTELNKECQVCLSDYENGDVLRILPCFHEFHTPCIDPWLKINHTCPVCRVEVAFDGGNMAFVNNRRE